jgi:fatty acid desaturase
MKTTSQTLTMSRFDELIMRLDLFPLGAIWRTLVGYVMIPAATFIGIDVRPWWRLVPFILGFLIAIRITFGLIRKAVPFSAAIQNVWSERRVMAKRYDSFQWQKFLWFGIGLMAYMFLSRDRNIQQLIVSLACTLCGVLGFVRWRIIHSQRTNARESSQPTGNIA